MFEIAISLVGTACSIVGVVIAAAVGFVVLRSSGAFASSGGSASVEALKRMYEQTLGYTAVHAADPVAEAKAGRPATSHQVRAKRGFQIHYESSTHYGGTSTSMVLFWRIPLKTRLEFGLHVADAKVADGMKRAVSDLAMSRVRNFKPAFPNAITVGDSELDGRFRFYTNDPVAARTAVLALRDRLLAVPYVDVVASGYEVRLDDPFQQALLTTMGGPLGMGQIASPAGIEKQVRLHEAVADLLIGLATQMGDFPTVESELPPLRVGPQPAASK